MRITIACETFPLTDAIKLHTESSLEKIIEMLPEETIVRAFYRQDGHNSFTAVLKTHFGHKDLVSHKVSEDLYQAISESSAHLKGILRRLKTERKKSRRRQNAEAIAVGE